MVSRTVAASPTALLDRIWAAAKPDADRVDAALAARAPIDETAARVLLQVRIAREVQADPDLSRAFERAPGDVGPARRPS